MKKTDFNYIRLPLERSYNTRELGGYGTREGKATQWHRFLRADDISSLTKGDIEFLIDYGVRTVIDLRGEMEVEMNPDALKGVEGIDYNHISLADVLHLEEAASRMSNLDSLYEGILLNAEGIKRVFEVIAHAKEGAILFHCSAGKDRTGVVGMLLLDLAGVADVDIIANYQVSHTYLTKHTKLIENMKNNYPDMEELIYSVPETIQKTLDILYNKYESTYKYLLACGVKEEDILKAKRRLIEENN